MTSVTSTLILLFAAFTAVTAKTIQIGTDGLKFVPEAVEAAVDDVLEFHFGPRNHSVVMGDFGSACVPAAKGGFFSGFLPAAEGEENNKVFRVTVNDTSPVVFYCSQNSHQHCTAGMVGVVNSNNDSLNAYKTAAAKIPTALSPAEVFGGVLGPRPTETALAPATTAASSNGASRGGGAGAVGAALTVGTLLFGLKEALEMI
ncbi:extracellular serine-rich protein [Podospora appendiculata]|uniref:Extracellular serine-rich protein n=1 Tax=Podospora appendiculata TaxID=314037 RepID=A0AAE1CB87_9PEZI|nr:extracellular serine-rich protein [Podospora appendiculata]